MDCCQGGIIPMPRSKHPPWWAVACLAVLLAPGRAGHGVETAPAAAEVPPLLLEDFEGATLGARPYLWKERKAGGAAATVGAERAALAGSDSNKALKLQ